MSIWDQAPAPLELCPTPQKIKYPDWFGATRKVKLLSEADKPTYPYLCKCGWWHITSRKKRKKI